MKREVVFAEEVSGTDGGYLVTLSCGHKRATRERSVEYDCRECDGAMVVATEVAERVLRAPAEPRVKQVIVIRRDLGMRRGKEIAQGAHASMAWLTHRLRTSGYRSNLAEHSTRHYSDVALSAPEVMWVEGLFTKVVVQVADEAALLAVVADAKTKRIEAHLITDAGLTEFAGKPTHTAVAVGPDYEETVDLVTKHLRLY